MSRPISPATAVSPLVRYLPILDWLPRYRRTDLAGDLLAGLIVAIMLVPQGMSYALLAGLPPQVGLYASIIPLVMYGVLGTSRTLAVGPVAIVSLMVASGIGGMNAGGAELLQLAVTLAVMVGLLQAVMGVLRIGFLVNFLSHPVLVGFTAAAAIIIGFSQVKHLLGFSVPRAEYFYEQVVYTVEHLGQTNLTTLAIGLGAVGVLLYFKMGISAQLRRWGVRPGWVVPVSKSAPLIIVLLGTLLVWGFNLTETAGINIVGDVPAGLPPLSLPSMDPTVWRALLPPALTISFVGYMESISVAKSFASKRRQKVGANQELIALGAANLGAAFTGGYPVTGGFSRSVVNFAAGANTGLASIVTAVLVTITVIFLTPLFYFLPNAVLGAIVLVAVTGLVDVKNIRHIWH